MKALKIVRVLAAVAAISAMAPVHAQLSTSVDVTVNLTSQCRWQGGTAPTGVTVDFGDYTAFQAGANSGTTPTVTFECTRGFGAASPTVAWDGATSYGVVAGLNYQLTVSAPSKTPGTAATAAAGGIGSADKVTFTLGGTMPGGQAGTGSGGAATDTRTLTVTF